MLLSRSLRCQCVHNHRTDEAALSSSGQQLCQPSAMWLFLIDPSSSRALREPEPKLRPFSLAGEGVSRAAIGPLRQHEPRWRGGSMGEIDLLARGRPVRLPWDRSWTLTLRQHAPLFYCNLHRAFESDLHQASCHAGLAEEHLCGSREAA